MRNTRWVLATMLALTIVSASLSAEGSGGKVSLRGAIRIA